MISGWERKWENAQIYVKKVGKVKKLSKFSTLSVRFSCIFWFFGVFSSFFVKTGAFFRGNSVKKSDFSQKMIHLYKILRDKMQKTTFFYVKNIKKLKSRKKIVLAWIN